MAKDVYILGINGLGVLPSACLTKNGQLVAMAEEERFTRTKGSFGVMPSKAAKYCLSQAGISLEEITQIAFAWDCNFYRFKMPLFLLKQLFKRAPIQQDPRNVRKVATELLKYQPFKVKQALKASFKKDGIKGVLPKVSFVAHHHAHAASSYYSSGFDQAHVLVIDGSGENVTTSIWYGNKKKIHQIKNFKIPDSLGWFYQCITEYLGFQPNNHEGKTMALAAYGNPNKEISELFKEIIQWSEKGGYTFNPKYAFAGRHTKGAVFSKELEDLLGKSRDKNEPISQRHKDIAFACQDILEKISSTLVEEVCQQPSFNGNLCIAGGVGLNCKMNGNFSHIKGVKNLYIPPFSNDTGTALGAAQKISIEDFHFDQENIQHAYWGPEFTNEEIKNALENAQLSYTFEENISQKAAQLLAKDKIVAWFQGRMEVGSRALGARSILANPKNPKTRDFINSKVKNRELWRPFAASFLEEKKMSYFTENIDAPFMTLATTVRGESLELISAAVHIDNTTRPQIVSKKTNPKYWSLIHYFGNLKGCYAVLNTSFNLKEEPIICTPDQAINSFLNSGIDALAIGDFLIEKP